MSSINCTWEEFKKMANEFHKSLPTLNEDELENAWKCLGLAYLGMSEPIWQNSAAILLQMEMRAYMQREFELISAARKESA